MRRRLPLLLPILILVVGGLGMRGLRGLRAEPDRQPRPRVVPSVEVQTVRLAAHRLVVRTQGTVSPRTSSRLVAEVGGRVVRVSDHFRPGSFFEEGDTLLVLDDRDLRVTLAQAQEALVAAQLRLALEDQERSVAAQEWESFEGGPPSDLVLRRPQLASARAAVASAQTLVDKARRDLDRSRLVAPYDGRIRSKNVDLGDVLAPGTVAATVYAVDYAEIRLPIPDSDLAYLDLPLGFRAQPRDHGPRVVLRCNFAQREGQWEGFIERSEAEIDSRTRMVHLVARVADPYGRNTGTTTPLAVGMFVQAEILGREVEGIRIPTAALRPDSTVLVVDAQDRIDIREVEVLQRGRRDTILAGGLEDGERICLSPLSAVVEAMRVQPVGESER